VAFPNIQNSSYANSYVVGKAIWIQHVYHYTGVNPETGLYTFATKNANNWEPSAPTDYVVSKPITQSLYGGFDNSLSYSKFQLSFFFQFVKQLGYNYVRASSAAPGIDNHDQPIWFLSHWQKPGDNSNVEQYTRGPGSNAFTAFSNFLSSDGVIADASFIRLKNLAISYELPDSWKRSAHLQTARVYIQAQNLLTITGYKGLDPETQGLTLPPLRMITGGVRVSL
jgi:hypothetical protein